MLSQSGTTRERQVRTKKDSGLPSIGLIETRITEVDLSIEMGKSVVAWKLTTDFEWMTHVYSHFCITQNNFQ
jgi:hypothetical protein